MPNACFVVGVGFEVSFSTMLTVPPSSMWMQMSASASVSDFSVKCSDFSAMESGHFAFFRNWRTSAIASLACPLGTVAE